MENKKISIASDHAGISLKELVSEHLSREGHEIINHGTFNNDSVDYPVSYTHLTLPTNREV